MITYEDQIKAFDKKVDAIVVRYVSIIDGKLSNAKMFDEIVQEIWGSSDDLEGVALSDAVTQKLVEIYTQRGYYAYRHQDGSDWYGAYAYDGRYTFVLENRPCETKTENKPGFLKKLFSIFHL